MEQKSIVAQLREEIEQQERAAQLGLTGMAITSKHDFIIARLERIATLLAERRTVIGDLQAVQEVDEAVDALLEELTGRNTN